MLFQDLPIDPSDGAFRWRDKRWARIDSSHAVCLDAAQLEPTFVPNCENVEPITIAIGELTASEFESTVSSEDGDEDTKA